MTYLSSATATHSLSLLFSNSTKPPDNLLFSRGLNQFIHFPPVNFSVWCFSLCRFLLKRVCFSFYVFCLLILII
ncbi:hypothetical protein CUMW_279870 [Citrus unshiu]|uniref:Uncharacterized protein n=1 Tax=Citrus unshiu TaxID=55188 RepID=A0A2H5N8R2_CITUN|nr:hypothetical protein CUMW_279870 [Citrus unshiu]